MDIIVLVKRVPDSEAQVNVREGGKEVVTEERHTVNFFDSLAIEEALRIREAHGGKVTAITVGTSASKEVLRTAMAMGVDESILVHAEDYCWYDPLKTAAILSKVIKNMQYDLILCGKEAFDDSYGVVGPAVAKMLGINYVTMVNKIKVDGNEIEVQREVEDGKEIFKLKLPALITTTKGLNEPRVPSVAGILKAMKTPIKQIELTDLGELPFEEPYLLEVRRFYEHRKTRKVKYVKGEPQEAVRTLIELLRLEAKVL